MEAVRSIQSTPQVSRVQERTRRPEIEERTDPRKPEAAYYEPRLSDSARLFNAIEESGFMSDQEISSLRDDLRKAVEQGDFDPEALAESAPDPVRELADRKNINLRDAMAGIAGSYARPAYDAAAPAPADSRETPGADQEIFNPEYAADDRISDQQNDLDNQQRSSEYAADDQTVDEMRSEGSANNAVADTEENRNAAADRETLTRQIMDRVAQAAREREEIERRADSESA